MIKQIYDWDTDIVYLSDKLEVYFENFYHRLIDKLDEMCIPHGIINGTKDIWCRDYMPIQIQDKLFVGYNYNPDYLDDEPAYPYIERLKHLKGRDLRTIQSEVWRENQLPYKLNDSKVVLDGGNVVICDKYVILTDKIFDENGCKSDSDKAVLRQRLSEYFDNLIPIIIPWKPNGDDVFEHSDGMVKFQRRNWDYKPYALISPLTKKDTITQFEALGKDFYLDLIAVPDNLRAPGFYKYAWAYINYLQVGNKILIPAFNLPSDDYVKDLIKKYNPGCLVDNIEMREIAECGGALHCITWNIKQ